MRHEIKNNKVLNCLYQKYLKFHKWKCMMSKRACFLPKCMDIILFLHYNQEENYLKVD